MPPSHRVPIPDLTLIKSDVNVWHGRSSAIKVIKHEFSSQVFPGFGLAGFTSDRFTGFASVLRLRGASILEQFLKFPLLETLDRRIPGGRLPRTFLNILGKHEHEVINLNRTHCPSFGWTRLVSLLLFRSCPRRGLALCPTFTTFLPFLFRCWHLFLPSER